MQAGVRGARGALGAARVARERTRGAGSSCFIATRRGRMPGRALRSLPGNTKRRASCIARSSNPRWLELFTGATLGSQRRGAALALFATTWRRERRTPPLAPLSAFLIAVWSWSYLLGDRSADKVRDSRASLGPVPVLRVADETGTRPTPPSAPSLSAPPPAGGSRRLPYRRSASGLSCFHGAPGIPRRGAGPTVTGPRTEREPRPRPRSPPRSSSS